MDQQLRKLERAIAANPGDLALIQELCRLSERTGWTHKGQRVADIVKERILCEFNELDHFDRPLHYYSIFEEIGARGIPPLIEAFKNEILGTVWKAGFALGAMGASGRAAIPTLIAGLSHKHPVISAQSRWALAQLTPFSLTPLIDHLVNAAAEQRKLFVDCLGFMGVKAMAALEDLKALVGQSEGDFANTLEDLIESITGSFWGTGAHFIHGPTFWCLGTGRKQSQESFEHEVWGSELLYPFDSHSDSIAFDDVQSFDNPEYDFVLAHIKGWKPYEIVLRRSEAQLTIFDYDEGQIVDLTKVTSKNGEYFTRGELFYGAEIAVQQENPEAGGVVMERHSAPHADLPVYHVSCYST
jgi:hypothetical protein